VIQGAAFPEIQESQNRLASETNHLPKAMELKYRHPVAAEHRFKMLPGLKSFQKVGEGEILARDIDGPVRAPGGGRLLMPLYQTQGEDGFFLIKEFHPSWLTVSEFLRRARMDRIVHWLPGIRRDSDGEGMVVNRRMARWFALEVLHLLGYRKEVDHGDRLVVLKQAE
jgi:succinylglutamate desuccinylase